MRSAMVVGILLALAAAAAGDEIVTRDGQSLKGTILSVTDEAVRIRTADGEFTLDRAEVARIVRDEDAPDPVEDEAGGDVIQLKAGGRRIVGKILSEDATTVTIRENGTGRVLGVDRSAIEWVQKEGESRATGGTAPPEGRPAGGDGPAPGAGNPRRGPAPAPSPALRAWIDLCVKHLGSEDPGVQRSAAAALRAAGPAARPALEAAAGSDDARLAQAAQRALQAGDPRSAPGRAGAGGRRDMGQTLAERLGLDEDQTTKVSAIFADMRTKMREVMQEARSGGAPREEMRERMTALREETDAKLAEVLTEDQMARYREMMQQRMRGGFGGRRGGGGGGRGGGGGGR